MLAALQIASYPGRLFVCAFYAESQAARLASAAPWQIHVDPPPMPPGHYLEVNWEDFRTSSHEYRKAKSSSLVYHLDFDGRVPVLWLNEGVPDLQPVLISAGHRGMKAAIRNALFDSIAQSVWLALVLQAVQAVPAEETEPPEDWQKGVIQRFGPLVNENMDEESACTLLVKEVRDPVQIANVMPRLLAAVQSQVNVMRSTTGVLGALEE